MAWPAVSSFYVQTRIGYVDELGKANVEQRKESEDDSKEEQAATAISMRDCMGRIAPFSA